MKKLFAPILAVALLAMTAACSEHFIVPDGGKQIGFAPYSNLSTKAPIDGTTLPDDTRMFVSAYHNETDPASSENYFSGVEFSKETSNYLWTSATPRYWPIGGSLNFLVYTSNSGIDAPAATWNASNTASEVSLVVPDNYNRRNDILYGSANAQTYVSGGTPMTFHHALSLVVFKVMISDEDDNYVQPAGTNTGIEITGFTINDVSYGGTVDITNTPGGSPVVQAAWSSPLTAQTRPLLNIAGSEFIPSNLKNATNYTPASTAFGDAYFIVPPQSRTSFTISYTLHNGFSGNNPQDKTLTYTYNCNDGSNSLSWEMGKKYIYEITFDLHKITILPTITNWDDSSIGVTVQAQ